jgi:hypothetical protein
MPGACPAGLGKTYILPNEPRNLLKTMKGTRAEPGETNGERLIRAAADELVPVGLHHRWDEAGMKPPREVADFLAEGENLDGERNALLLDEVQIYRTDSKRDRCQSRGIERRLIPAGASIRGPRAGTSPILISWSRQYQLDAPADASSAAGRNSTT